MTRETFERQIQDLLDEVLILGSMVQQATLDAVDSLQKRDIEASRRVYHSDHEINDKRFALEDQTLTLIATQSPMARDLRVLAAVLEILTELERMGDYAKGIARININLGQERLLKPLVDLPKMAEITVDMLRRALDAFVEGDAEQAYAIPKDDDQVDALFNKINRELVEFMIQDPTTIDKANHLMWAAHNLERMADRVINLCERAIYVGTGELVELSMSDDEVN
ncbi:MAG: phosphate signaling complex protein PhoU [Anaerolineales bacterium]|nr:phosphate signaling complex protein PhoU [Anaerolineales bacterium]